MQKKYFILLLLMTFHSAIIISKELVIPSDAVNYFESIGKSKIHLQKIPLIYINVIEGKTSANILHQEIASIENHLKSLNSSIQKFKDRNLKIQLRYVKSSFKDFKSLVNELNENNLGTIDKQQMIIQFQLNNLHSGLENVLKENVNHTPITTLKSNIVVADKQVLNLKKYKFNQKMYAKTHDEEYLIENKELFDEISASVNKLIIDNTKSPFFSKKLSNLKQLVNYMRINESHMRNIVDDTSLLFENIRDAYRVTYY